MCIVIKFEVYQLQRWVKGRLVRFKCWQLFLKQTQRAQQLNQLWTSAGVRRLPNSRAESPSEVHPYTWYFEQTQAFLHTVMSFPSHPSAPLFPSWLHTVCAVCVLLVTIHVLSGLMDCFGFFFFFNCVSEVYVSHLHRGPVLWNW